MRLTPGLTQKINHFLTYCDDIRPVLPTIPIFFSKIKIYTEINSIFNNYLPFHQDLFDMLCFLKHHLTLFCI